LGVGTFCQVFSLSGSFGLTPAKGLAKLVHFLAILKEST